MSYLQWAVKEKVEASKLRIKNHSHLAGKNKFFVDP